MFLDGAAALEGTPAPPVWRQEMGCQHGAGGGIACSSLQKAGFPPSKLHFFKMQKQTPDFCPDVQVGWGLEGGLQECVCVGAVALFSLFQSRLLVLGSPYPHLQGLLSRVEDLSSPAF